MEIIQENREGKKGHLPTEGIILFRPDKRHSVRARKPARAMMPNDLTKQPLPTYRPPAFLPPSWSQVVFLCEILTFKAHFKLYLLHQASPDPLTNLLQYLPSKAPTFTLTLHQYDFGHFRFVLSRLKEVSVTTGTNYMNVLSTVP